MKKVFGIICHRITNPLVCTINNLSSFSDNYIILHVDSKCDLGSFEFLSSENVHILQERVEVKWGGFSLIDATIKILKKASVLDFDYFFLISGDDIPCKSNHYMDNFLNEINLKNIVHYDSRDGVDNIAINRVKFKYPDYFFRKDKTTLEKIKCKAFRFFGFLCISNDYIKAANKGVKFFKGSNWISLNSKTLKSLVFFIEENTWYVDAFYSSYCCDEVFFHTALKFMGVVDFYIDKNKGSHDLRYIDWNTGPDYPRTLDASDLFKISNTMDLFARKFSPNETDDVLMHFIHKDSQGH